MLQNIANIINVSELYTQNGYNGKFYVIYILSQLKNNVQKIELYGIWIISQ